MIVLVNGLGNIGQTVLAFLVKYRDVLHVESIYVFKNTPQPFDDFSIWTNQGVMVVFDKGDIPTSIIDFVFDCTASGFSKLSKVWYETFDNLKGASAQGTEHDFGESIMLGLNENQMPRIKYQHVVSCNTHGILSLLKYYSGDLSNVESADFVVVRRSEDIGNHERLVSANVVARHRDPELGTHHAEDATTLLQAMGYDIPLCSSDVTTPSQLMHSVRFNITLKETCDKGYPYVGATQLFDSNKVFEIGRRHGLQGRIYNQSVIVDNNVLKGEKFVKGWAFIPQEGNTILSTVAGYAYKCLSKSDADKVVAEITKGNLLF